MFCFFWRMGRAFRWIIQVWCANLYPIRKRKAWWLEQMYTDRTSKTSRWISSKPSSLRWLGLQRYFFLFEHHLYSHPHFFPVADPRVRGALPSGAAAKSSQGCNWILLSRFLLSGLTKHAVLLYISQANSHFVVTFQHALCSAYSKLSFSTEGVPSSRTALMLTFHWPSPQ